MNRKATQIVVPIIDTTEPDVQSLTSEHERLMKDLNEKLGSGWRIFATHTVTNNFVTYLVYVLTKLETEKCREELTC